MIFGIDHNCVNRCGGNKRVISDYRPRSRIAAAIRRFPDAAANRPGIGNDATIRGRGWIDSNGVNSTFGGRVIETTRAACHALWLRAERGKSARAKRRRMAGTTLLVRSSRDPACDSSVLSSCDAHPRGIEATCGICQTIVPVQLQLRKTRSFAPRVIARHRHVARRLRHAVKRTLPRREYGKCESHKTQAQTEQRTQIEKASLARALK